MSRNPPIYISPRSGRIMPAAHCRKLFLGPQDSGGWVDRMGGPPALPFDAGYTDAEAWNTNPGWLTTGVSSINDYLTIAASPLNGISLNGRAGIIVLRYRKTAPGSNEIVLGSYTSTTFPGGLQVTANSAGSLALAVSTQGNVAVSLVIGSSYGPLDGGEHTAVWFLPPDAVSAQMGFDGLPASTAPSTGLPGQECYGLGDGNIMNIGAARGGSAKGIQVRALHIYNPVCASLASLNVQLINSWLHDHPLEMLPYGLLGLAA